MSLKEHSSAAPTDGNGGRARSTCRTCGRNTCVYRIDGRLVITEAERLSVVPDDHGPRAIVFARQLHSEMCSKYVAENEREELRKDKLEYERKQRQNGPRLGTRTRGL